MRPVKNSRQTPSVVRLTTTKPVTSFVMRSGMIRFSPRIPAIVMSLPSASGQINPTCQSLHSMINCCGHSKLTKGTAKRGHEYMAAEMLLHDGKNTMLLAKLQM